VISKTQEDFWRCFERLPAEVQQQARERFQLWQKDAFNAALYFKPLLGDVWSVRVNQQYRALGRLKGSLVVPVTNPVRYHKPARLYRAVLRAVGFW
jgi:plasmid maintenance system killer protein